MTTMTGRLSQWYYAHEFAELVGVTVRTLHHYDHRGLLTPSARSEGGYRLYSERDLPRLQQILTLKFVGFSLKEIRSLLDGSALDLAATLRIQRGVIAEKRRQMDMALAAITRAEAAIGSGAPFDWQTLRDITEAITMDHDGGRADWVKKYYTEEQLAALARRWTPEMQAQVSQDWAYLGRDIEASRESNPAGPQAQTLADRYAVLIAGFTGSDPSIAQNLSNLYADREHWPAGAPMALPFSDEGAAFILKALAIRTERGQQ